MMSVTPDTPPEAAEKNIRAASAAVRGRRMPSCKEIGELSSGHLDVRPGLLARIRVFLHCRMCGPCRTTSRNWVVIREAVRRAAKRVPDDCEGLADCSKQRMRGVIEAALLASAAGEAASTETVVDGGRGDV